MKLLMLCMIAAGCRAKPVEPTAKGSLVLDARDAGDVFLATEAEVMRSEPILRRVGEDLHVEVKPDAIRVTRRPGTMILDVAVHDRDPAMAATLCNKVMETYVVYRMQLGLQKLERERLWLNDELERSPNNAELQRRLQENEMQQGLHDNDVRLLDQCRAPKRR